MEPIGTERQAFSINAELVAGARLALKPWKRLYWVVGGSGSGKTTVCRELSEQAGLPVYDMDARIYGSFHARFTADRHPANFAWAQAQDGLSWLLFRPWESYLQFSQAALPEYLDLLVEDLAQMDPAQGLLIDGGIFTPSLAARAIPANRIVCITASWQSTSDVWEKIPERAEMKQAFQAFHDPESAWRRFLEFDQQINRTLLRECEEAGILLAKREESTTVPELARRILDVFQLESESPIESNRPLRRTR